MNISIANSNSDFDLESCVEDIEYMHKFTSVLIDNMVKLSGKTSKLRDMGDEVVKTLMEYAENDDSAGTKFLDNIKEYSSCLSSVEDARDSEVCSRTIKCSTF
jgi:hypothetical protein